MADVKTGNIPPPIEQVPTGTILGYPDCPKVSPNVALYARGSSYGGKDVLERPLQRFRDYTAAHGYKISREVTEIGSSLNGTRKKLLKYKSEK